jgi:hypothetical protein
MIISFDTLAGVKFPELVAKIPKQYGTGYFWDEFGNAKNKIIRDAASGRKYIRVQGIWAKHVFGSQHETKAIEIGKQLQKIAAQYPSCLIEYSPYCEHKKDEAYMTTLLDKIQLHCPKVRLVNSPIAGGQWTRKYKNEVHPDSKPPGMPPGAYNFSYDGTNCVDAEVEKFKRDYANADGFFYWVPQFNLHKSMKKEDGAKRDALPTEDLIKSLIFIATNSKKTVKLAAGWIGKSHSDQHATPTDPRAGRVVLVGPKGKKFRKVTLGDMNLVDGGLTEDKRNTWRSGKWGYKMSRPLKVVADGITVGTIDPGFRENEYRNKS